MNTIDTPVIVLIYHRVTTLASDPQLLAVSPENFRSQLQFLKNNYPILRFEDDWTKVATPSIAITFDDGYADNVLEALPIIEEVGIPVTFFVSTGLIGTLQEFWWDELERVILGKAVEREQFVLRDDRFGRSWSTLLQADREKLYNEMQPLMKRVSHTKRNDWLAQLREWAGVGEEGRGSHRAMNREELLLLASSKWVTIGAHTVRHDPLSILPSEQQKTEIISSKKYLEDITGKEITVFSYPFGCGNDYDADSIRICKDAGFVRVAANFTGQAHRWTDQFQMPRQLVRNWTLEQFEKQMKKFWVL